MQPFLSICVPSRNRQRYLIDVLAFLRANPRDDVEFVIADNSDDPAIMNAHMDGLPEDRRIRFLPSESRTLSMIDNWERTVAAARGQWVSVIGDDDLIDPDVADAIRIAASLKPGLEVLSWNVLSYDWKDRDSGESNIAVPLGTSLHDLPKAFLERRAFRWDDASAKLSCGCSLYHSAISARLLSAIRARFGGRVFSHPTVDYDSAFKIIALGEAFAFSVRPFSIFGACMESNTRASHSIDGLRKAAAVFAAELGRDYDNDPFMADFPFPSTLGLTAAIGQVQHYFRRQHGIGMDGWEAGFASACAKNCDTFAGRAEFDIVADGYRDAFSRWQGGKWLGHFKPVYKPRPTGRIFTGLIDHQLLVSDRIGGAVSPSDFYRIINAVLVRPAELNPVLAKLPRAATS